MARHCVAGAFDPTPEPYPNAIPSIIPSQKKAPAGEDRRAPLTGGGRKSGQNPTVAIEL